MTNIYHYVKSNNVNIIPIYDNEFFSHKIFDRIFLSFNEALYMQFYPDLLDLYIQPEIIRLIYIKS